MPETKITADRISTTVEFEFSELSLGNGTAALPALAFETDQDTGVYRRLSDSVGVATGGALRFDFNNAVTRSHVPMEILNSTWDATLLLDSQSTGRASQISFRNSTPVTHRIGIETDTDAGGGAFLGNANSLNFEVSGSNRMYFSNQSTARFFLDGGTLQSNTPGQMEIGSAANYWGRIHLANGTAALPSYTFGGDPDTGMYLTAANTVGFSAGGTKWFEIPGNGIIKAFGNPALDVRHATEATIDLTETTNSVVIRCRSTNVGNGAYIGTDSAHQFGLVAGNTYHMILTSGVNGQARFRDGSAAAPHISFQNDPDTGMYRSSTNDVRIAAGGVDVGVFNNLGLTVKSGDLRPDADGTQSCGISGKRWSAVWAANGTIQTSHSSTKEVLGDIAEDAEIPKGIYFKRPGSDKIHVGFLADNLPQEAFYDDGVSVETSSPIGVLCANVRRLDRENKELRQMIEDLKAKLGE